jgi:methionine sulfoxide reductase catalytic subunit
MVIKKPDDVRSSEITPEELYHGRREFLRKAGLLGIAAASAGMLGCVESGDAATQDGQQKDEPTPFKDVTTYNNYYEFGTDKSDPAENAKNFKTKPWSVQVEGMVSKPATYNLEDFIKPYKLEERVYRHRCVEAWSMVIPWLGFPMADLIKTVQPLSSAKFIEFQTLFDPKQMPGQREPILPWPYAEGLRLDEAMHPLAIFAVGLYGKMLLPQNGAPLRTVIPWKYGFKATKSIVKVRFTDKQPQTAWNQATPNEYGFYANVNPEVDHPRWSQAKERRIGEFRKRPTLMFNGYADQVGRLYQGMDLRKNY